MISDYLAIITPIGIAIAWVWSQHLSYNKSREEARDKKQDREEAYTTRLEARLLKKDEELEKVLKELMHTQTENRSPEEVLQDIIDHDPGLMFAKRRIGPNHYRMVRVSKGYAVLYLGGAAGMYDGRRDDEIWGTSIGKEFTDNDEIVHSSQSGLHIEENIYSPLTKRSGKFIGRKFPIRLGVHDYIIGIGTHEDVSS